MRKSTFDHWPFEQMRDQQRIAVEPREYTAEDLLRRMQQLETEVEILKTVINTHIMWDKLSEGCKDKGE